MSTDKILAVQLDPNGYCNASCWFCPVQYGQQTPETEMTPTQVEHILHNLSELRSDSQSVSPDLKVIWSSSYNEILLYKHLPEFLELFRKYDFKTTILSHGLNLTQSRVDLLAEYSDVVVGLALNIPAISAKLWQQRTGFDARHIQKLKRNVHYAGEKLSDVIADRFIFVNGIRADSDVYERRSGIIAMDYHDTELPQQLDKIRSEFAPSGYHVMSYQIDDRSGNLPDKLSLKEYKTNVTDCGLLVNHTDKLQMPGVDNLDFGSHMRNWLHINSQGDCFICCNDYDNNYVFGNVFETDIEDIWQGDVRQSVIARAFNNICQRCEHAR